MRLFCVARPLLFVFLAFVCGACGNDGATLVDAGRVSENDDAPSRKADAGRGRTEAGSSEARDSGSRKPVSDPPAGGDKVEDSCAGLDAEADARFLPIDIVWSIDTSGSMLTSFPAIQQALTQFSAKVNEAGIDAHIVLLAGQGLCVPAPLGSGSCGMGGLGDGIGGGMRGGIAMPTSAPDSREPNFLHLNLPFGSGEGMGVILNNHSYYRSMLRPNARTHLVLTEDGAPPMSAAAVIDHIEGRASATSVPAWEPPLAKSSWMFSGVVCSNGLGAGACLLAFQAPTTTLSLIESSGGVSADLSLAGQAGADPFASLLDELATEVIVGAELSCEYDIPTTPAGETFDRGRVNVLFGATPDADKQTIPRAATSCGDGVAWVYDNDDAPTQIVLCPAACERVRAERDARVQVRFGCETKTIVI